MTAPFITLEGIGGTGKSTARDYIRKLFQDYDLPHVITREPGGTPCAEQLRKLVREGFPGLGNTPAEQLDPMGVALLFNAARVDHVNKVIRPSLEVGHTVVSDRYCDTTFAYQSTYDGVPLEKLKQLHELAVGLNPDKTFIFTCPVYIAASRISDAEKQSDKFDRASLEQQEAMQQVFLDLYKTDIDRYTLIDASYGFDEVREQLFPHLMKFIRPLTKPVKGQCKGGCPDCVKPRTPSIKIPSHLMS